jgi:hypothetical protein
MVKRHLVLQVSRYVTLTCGILIWRSVCVTCYNRLFTDGCVLRHVWCPAKIISWDSHIGAAEDSGPVTGWVVPGVLVEDEVSRILWNIRNHSPNTLIGYKDCSILHQDTFLDEVNTAQCRCRRQACVVCVFWVYSVLFSFYLWHAPSWAILY